MQLTKTQEAEILKTYGTYFDSYMKGDIETVASLLDDEYTQVGSAEGEVFFNKKDAVQFLYDTMHQVAGKIEMRNRVVKLEKLENTFLIHEFADLYALAGTEWVFYSKFRASTFMQNRKDEWKIIHQHSSFPDTRADEGQNIAVDKIAAENQQLREAVKRRTIELEEKNRDLEIEASLERVRAVAMGMKRPADMLDICRVITSQLQQLDIKEIRNVQTAIVDESKGTYQNFEYYKLHDKTIITEVDYYHHEMTTAFVTQMLSGPEEIFSQNLKGKELRDWFEHQKTTNQFIDSYLETAMSLNYYWYSIGPVALGVSTYAPLNTTETNLLKRFRNVFELAYRRFMDIEKAVEQAREAQIENALEKVRSRTMAMQRSEELPDAANNLFLQMQALEIPAWSAGYCVWDENKNAATACMSSEGVMQKPFKIPTTGDPSFVNFYEAYKRDEVLYVEEIGGEALVSHYKYMRKLPVVGEALGEIINAGFPLPTFQIFHVAYFSQGYLLFITYEPVPEMWEVFKRFAKVFEQTYTRFLDLQRAEAQAREAQIEAALERVRSRTMGMQKSDELKHIIQVVYDQLVQLNISVEHTGFIMDYHTGDEMNIWLADHLKIPSFITIPYFDSPHWNSFLEAKKNGNDFFVNTLNLEEKDKFYQQLFTFIPGLPEEAKEKYFRYPGLAISTVLLENIGLYIENFSGIPFTDEDNKTLMRFGKVFQQTYTRFLDLQKAEEQAREAQIELALERVRAKTMAMHNSQDVADTAAIMFDEVNKLGIETFRCGIGIMHETKGMEVWTAKPNEQGRAELIVGRLDMMAHPLLYGAYNTWVNKQDSYFYELKGDDLIAYYNVINTQAYYPVKYDVTKLPSRIMHSEFHFPEGCLFVFSLSDLSAEAIRIFKRFSGVFGQTYRRYLDLQKAEANAKEAKIEASLERVRSKAMSMHSSQDLGDTIGVFYHELELFSITPRRCGVGLIDKESHVTELSTMNTTEEGKSIEIVGRIKLSGHPVLEGIYDNWLLNKEYHPVLKGKEIREYYRLLKPQIAFPEYPHDAIHYGYFFYFPEGGVYAWADKQMAEDELKIYRRFTSVLSLTYKRYKDLKIAEAHAQQSELDLINLKAEKQRTEEALTELKATQSQLIQAEKMASLGELTAGIAHEIQNPLNFVNNFSEVSNELIVEMNEELLKGDIEEAKVIANDILQNLEKINHHGKRAAAIVKGMLQHSRTSSATKEPTDINKLADEYLRLAYHGLRAKDKTFNATLRTDFDESIGNINIIPQDIGRVILNLITNAFYAVGEKKLQQHNDYEPTVSVRTKRINDKIEVCVKDNGSGIPQKVLDKIFQPFFTTKPTGQGTGLGLSLAYDIVKAHGGELKVETVESAGSEFTISLPAS